jgi:hypothetical protein
MMTMEIEIMAKQNGNGQDNQVDALAALAKLSVQDLEQLLQNKKQEQARIAAEKGVEARKDVENYLKQKWGLTLAQIWMACSNMVSKTYRNPENGQTYIYSGRGKVPGWLKGSDNKPNPAFEVKSN